MIKSLDCMILFIRPNIFTPRNAFEPDHVRHKGVKILLMQNLVFFVISMLFITAFRLILID